MFRLHSMLALSLLFAAGCAMNSFGHRDPACDPDARLAELLRSYEECKSRGANDSSHVLVDCDRVHNEIERLSLEFPRHVPTLFANATICWDEREPVQATRYLDTLFALEKSHPEAAVLRSRIAISDGNLSGARRLLESQIAYRPDHASLREALSAVLYMQHDLAGARGSLDVAEALGAPDWRVAYNRGLIAEAAGDDAGATSQYEAAIAANPEFAAARSRLSGVRAKLGDEGVPGPPAEAGGG